MAIAPELLEILVCPKCKEKVEYSESENVIICHTDKLRFPIREGIPIMLVDEAESF